MKYPILFRSILSGNIWEFTSENRAKCVKLGFNNHLAHYVGEVKNFKYPHTDDSKWIAVANQNDLPVKNNKIVCLCGSTKFKQAFEDANREESLKGHIVLTVAMFGHIEGLDMDGDAKKVFDELHFRKIDLCDEVLVLNVGGYIGESTKREIEYAKQKVKPIRFIEQLA
ncbi:MAG: hypothetical protein AB1332_09785 [Pseudomonadota bacterium]